MRNGILCSSAMFILLHLGTASAQVEVQATVQASGDWSTDANPHYVHKKKNKKVKRMVAADPDTTETAVPQTPPAPPTLKDVSPVPIQRIEPKYLDEPAPTPTPSPSPSPTPAPVSQTNPNFSSKMRDLLLGGDTDLLQNYREFLDNQDIRKNIFEVTLATGYLYNASSSSYYYKNYYDSGPSLDLGADIWFSPFLGINAEYRTTLLNEVNDSPTQNSFASTTQSWFDFGIKFRRFFGMALNSSSTTFGLRFVNYQMSVPQSSLSRAKLQNQGPELDLDLTVPNGHNSFWTFGILLQPFDAMTESSGASVRAGQSNQTIGFGADIGGEYRMSRQTCAFFKFSTLFFKTDFSGAANTPDPIAGGTPSNVPVTNIFYLFDLGLRLGH